MIDLANIKIQAGHGGDGAVSFRREKYVPRGGPDGGDGGNGGDIYAVTDHNMATLMDFRSKTNYKAGDGLSGGVKNQKGEDGSDLIIKLPLGTLIYEINGPEETLIADMDVQGKKVLLAKGGRGGVGNFRFRSSTNQAPTQYTKGGLGEEKVLKLEIKLVADVGFIGEPNAGKSTLINFLTNSQAKVASYPFTTLSPNLGVMSLKNGANIVIADIPGLIEGASEGKGLGDEFLRHVERTRILVHLIDPFVMDGDIVDLALIKYEVIQKELKSYKVDLTKKKQIVVINKMDITEVSEAFSSIQEHFKLQKDIEVIGISGVSGYGIEELVNRITENIELLPKKELVKGPTPVKIYTIDNLPNKKMIYKRGQVFERTKKHTGN